PAKPEDENSQGGERKVVPWHGNRFAIDEAANPRSHDDGSRQTGKPADSMDYGRTGEVLEGHVPSVELGQPATSPLPVAADGINEGSKYGAEDQIGTNPHASCDGPRDDSGRGGGKHGLKEPVGRRAVGIARDVPLESKAAKREVGMFGRVDLHSVVSVRSGIHNAEANGEIEQHADAD